MTEDKCKDCVHRKDLVECLESMKQAIGKIEELMDENHKLKQEKLLLSYKMLCQKKGYEKLIRKLSIVPENPLIKTASGAFLKKLSEQSQAARKKMEEDKVSLVQTMKNKYGGRRILFVLPVGSPSGGGTVIVSEAAAMRSFGVDAQIINYAAYQHDYEVVYKEFGVPTIFVPDFAQVVEYKKDYDVICATSFYTVLEANFPELANYTKTAYYVQDYEPLFCEEGSQLYEIAKQSYTLVEQIQCVTKTNWNKEMVKENTGVECKLLCPSLEIDFFYPEKEEWTDREKIVIAAMIRPTTPRRAAGETMEILQRIFRRYGTKVEIHIFGANEVVDSEFFLEHPTDFDYENHGIVIPQQVADILRKADIFVDFSIFQAMGLTAMEAMASGCAVIVPENGGATSFAVNEKNALVVDTANLDVCEKALMRLIEDYELRQKITLQAVVDICNYYPERCAGKFLEAVFD